MSDRYDSMEDAFNDALEEAASGHGHEPEGFGADTRGADGFGSFEGEGFDGFDHYDGEGDAFLGKAFKGFGRLVRQLPLKQLAQAGARIAGGAMGGPIGAQLGGMVGGMLGEDQFELEGDGEGEGFDFEGEGFDFEGDGEGEGESGLLQEDAPQAFGLDSLTDSLAESLATQAAETDSEADASALLGGVTIHIVTRAPVSVRRVSPVLLRSGNRLGRFLRRRRRTRPLVKAIPKIQKTAVKMLANHAAKGGKVTPKMAAKAMAKATVKTLGTPKAAAKSLANNAVKSRRVAIPPSSAPRNRGAISRAER